MDEWWRDPIAKTHAVYKGDHLFLVSKEACSFHTILTIVSEHLGIAFVECTFCSTVFSYKRALGAIFFEVCPYCATARSIPTVYTPVKSS